MINRIANLIMTVRICCASLTRIQQEDHRPTAEGDLLVIIYTLVTACIAKAKKSQIAEKHELILDMHEEGDPNSSTSASDTYEDYGAIDDDSFYPSSCSNKFEHEWDYNEDTIEFIRPENSTMSTCF